MAKVKTIGVTWGLHSKERLYRAKPDFIVNNLRELESIIFRDKTDLKLLLKNLEKKL